MLISLLFHAGNYWKHLDSIIISHVLDEAENFIPLTFEADQDYNFFISSIIPTNAQSAGIRSQIAARYPPAHKDGGVFSTERQRFKALIGDVIFLCNIRALTDAYIGKNFNLQYSTAPHTHGADIPATFDFRGFDLGLIREFFPGLIPGFESFSQTYQSYLVSHARTGNPNTYRKSHGGFEAVYWPRPDNRGDALRRVLNTTDTGFEIVTDEETRKSTCRFWEGIAQEATKLGGLLLPFSPFRS